MNNPFEFLSYELNGFKDSDIPEDRLFYIKIIKILLDFGEKLYRRSLNEELKQNIIKLKSIIENYKVYPKI